MKRNVLLGIALLIIGSAFSSVYDVAIKWLPADTNAATFMLVRQCVSILIALPLWLHAGASTSKKMKIHLIRGNIGVFGALFLVLGLMSLPLATVSSLFYSAPLMIMLMGGLFLKEKISGVQALACIIAFVGILIILRPSQVNIFGLAVIASAFVFSICQLLLKKLPHSESPAITLFFTNLFGFPPVLAFVAYQGVEGLSWSLLLVAILANGSLLIYQWFCVLAYRQAQASEIAIAEYSGLLFCIFFGWLFFDEWLDGLSWLGTALVIMPSLLLSWLSSRRGRGWAGFFWGKLRGRSVVAEAE
ncbi:EamA-like transporter family protein [Sinobacterium caligoides]|uniref:EamA-like transporter family protein n=1 Tax=Sinobacterium caligoides TaxID=933926 RepID=A0A3N2DK34_9GAMM|nr:DMT family transporter [Sinobacterium caligoides]ROS00137.1 EamA-like transporter family protein [Sinobacterium caligoides]